MSGLFDLFPGLCFLIFHENTVDFSVNIMYLPNKGVKKQSISMKERFLFIKPLIKVCTIHRNTSRFKHTQNIKVLK